MPRHVKSPPPRRWPRATALAALAVICALALGRGALWGVKRLSDDRRQQSGPPANVPLQRDDTGPAPPSYSETLQPLLPRVGGPTSLKRGTPDALPAENIVAIQPSHQDDTGEGWHEYLVCGDIADQAIAVLGRAKTVKAWDVADGLTGSNNYRPRPTNTRAFDVEVAAANRAGARFFISIHNDAGAPSGILGEYSPGDSKGRAFTDWMVSELSRRSGLPNRGTRDVRLYSLEPERNRAEYRSLVEIGDNVADRAYLSSSRNRELVGEALAEAVTVFARRHAAK